MIRKMTPGDAEAVLRIYTEGLESGTATFNTVCPSWEEWDGAHLPVCRIVHEEDGAVLGWAALSPTSVRECYRGVAEVSIYTLRAFHRRGIGRELMEELKRQAGECGIWSLYSAILAVNAASIALHRVCGFREIGYRERIARDRYGVWRDTVLMEYRL